ncbi:MAG: endonuclease III [Phycisphaerae bacterium]
MKKTKARASQRPAHPRTTGSRETAAARQARVRRILAALKTAHPDAVCALRHRSALELLVATILSAQCTDERVNLVTPALFARYPDAASFATAETADLESLIRSTGFFRNKARNLIGMGRVLRDEFAGRVPDAMDALLRLPGVARKTANCVLGTWFGKNEGLVVDTHVGRIALRLRLLSTARGDKDAVRIEQDLMPLVPREDWTWFSHAVIQHGRTTCAARNPQCDRCPIANDCPSATS